MEDVLAPALILHLSNTTRSHERWLDQINTNLFGSIDMTRAILPHFREKRSGKIAFVGSYGGWCGEVGAGPYCTTKFALEGLFSRYRSCIGEHICLQLGPQAMSNACRKKYRILASSPSFSNPATTAPRSSPPRIIKCPLPRTLTTTTFSLPW